MAVIITENPGQELKSMLEELSPVADGLFVVCDEHTSIHCLPLLNKFLPPHMKIVTGAGERNKSLHTCSVIWEFLLSHGAGRNAVLINLGGGMITDLGGFAASVFKRGIRFFHMPTSLLSMVDASYGGKTGIDLSHYKNMIGTFSDPVRVIVSPLFLDTLPEAEWKNGFAEMLKHGLIADARLWTEISTVIGKPNSFGSRNEWPLVDWIGRAINIKSEIVTRDPYESGDRMLLNFGHTIGHALETYSLQQNDIPMSHGMAVAAGMICETFISSRLTGLPENSLNEITETIINVFRPAPIRKDSLSALLHIMQADKKATAGVIRIPLLREIGNAVIHHGVRADLILDSFHYYNSRVA